MTLERDSIKSAMGSIPLPEDRLDMIIDQSVFNHTVRKKRGSREHVKQLSAAVLVLGLSGTLLFTTPAGQQMISYLPFTESDFTTGSGAGELSRPKEAVYSLDEEVNEEFVKIHFTEVSLMGNQVDIAYQQIVDPEFLTEMMAVEAELFAIDNLGNEYEVPYNSGTAYGEGTREDLHWTATLHDLSPLAESVTFIPMATVSEGTTVPDGFHEIFEYDALKVNLADGSVEIVESPGLPEGMYDRW
ncbi:hypothetical protein [Jeotgalibacillus salarius]|uniref:DUF4179 domain-containing protein n=1 Tax=Jeotgalibacillus salarius TaxID=546023 RepID=A0A4Y8LER8_9BACL|nr:hypothetical protein [Jeotgalibacillus salarius]TFE00553.1 hypothetical protein E2626_11285 [Jeotgalibacillus salarius]